MTVKIAKSDLGLTGDDYTINFAWTDNVHDEGDYGRFSGDIMDFYISGDVAPGGRFKFSYISTAENASDGSEETEQPTETPDDAPDTDAPETNASTDGETEPSKKGCGSTVAVGLVVWVAILGAAIISKKKD
jgi:hypothetical protein